MPFVKRRQKLHKQFGNACQRCGYNKSMRALHFHHLDSSEKYDEKWAYKSQKNIASLKEIEAHPERFQLVCANCHAEIHDEEAKAQYNFEICQNCGKEFRSDKHRPTIGRGKFCSKQCQYTSRNTYIETFEEIKARFLSLVVIQEGCWDWNGSFSSGDNVPKIHLKQSNGNYTMKLCTRVSYEIYFGETPQGSVYRTCGNPKCLNPEHLTLTKPIR